MIKEYALGILEVLGQRGWTELGSVLVLCPVVQGFRALGPVLPYPEGPYILLLWNKVPKDHPHYGFWDPIP